MTEIEVSVREPRKPSTIVLRFNGHITWGGQTNGLPPTIFAFLITQDLDMATITKLIEEQSGAFIRSQAMYVQRDQGQIIDIRFKPQDRMLVPFHNIAFITVDLVNMAGELSEADEEGVERLPDGSEPLKN